MKTIVTTATAFSAVVFLSASTVLAIDTNSVSFNAGADLRVRQEIMGNVPGTPGGGMQSPVVRNKYSIYDNKATCGCESAEEINKLEKELNTIGYYINYARGDYNKTK